MVKLVLALQGSEATLHDSNVRPSCQEGQDAKNDHQNDGLGLDMSVKRSNTKRYNG